MRTERKRRRSGLLAIVAVLAVLAVVGALAAPNFFGGNGGTGSGNSGDNNSQVGGNGGRSGTEQGGGGPGSDQGSRGSGGGAAESATASASAGPSASSDAAEDVPERGVFTASAAEDTVLAFYRMTSDGDYDDSARLLSEDWRQSTFPNEGVFEGTFDKVESVDFIEGPDARVSGNEATVTGETHAVLESRTEHNRGTWYLVREGGRWKIDGWDVIPLSRRPA